MSEPLRHVSLVTLSVSLALLCGCGALNLQKLTGSGAKSQIDFGGNYSFASVSGRPSQPNSQSPGPVQGFVGAVANTGSAFTATFRLFSPTGCTAPATDLAFTGAMDSSGQITLTSKTLPNNPISITWLDDPSQSSNGIGTFTVSGLGPCAMPSTQFVSDGFSPVTGTYTGTFTSTAGTQAIVTATLTQGAANADGQFPETGSLTLATATCTNNFTVGGFVTGPTLAVAFNASAAASLGGFTATLPDHALTLTIPSGVGVLGACNPGSYSGVLSKQ